MTSGKSNWQTYEQVEILYPGQGSSVTDEVEIPYDLGQEQLADV